MRVCSWKFPPSLGTWQCTFGTAPGSHPTSSIRLSVIGVQNPSNLWRCDRVATNSSDPSFPASLSVHFFGSLASIAESTVLGEAPGHFNKFLFPPGSYSFTLTIATLWLEMAQEIVSMSFASSFADTQGSLPRNKYFGVVVCQWCVSFAIWIHQAN